MKISAQLVTLNKLYLVDIFNKRKKLIFIIISQILYTYVWSVYISIYLIN